MDRPNRVELARFRRLTTVNLDGCWLFGGTDVTKDGYVRWRSGPGKERLMAHVWSYMAHKGPIPDGMQVGHTCHDRAVEAGTCTVSAECRHRRCTNPDHLELQTPSENTMAQNHHHRNKDCCPKGHPYDADNTMVGADGKRRCRACKAITNAARPSRAKRSGSSGP